MPWSTEAAADSPAAAEQVWALYADVSSWPRWDHELVAARLDGALAAGAVGMLKPKGGPTSPFVVTAAELRRSFTCVTALPHPRLPLARIVLDHELTPLPGGGTRIMHRAWIAGPLGPLIAWLLGPKLVFGLPTAVQALAALAATPSARGTSALDSLPPCSQESTPRPPLDGGSASVRVPA